jgi:glycosyltransferase involved in cell wall biosynthesis
VRLAYFTNTYPRATDTFIRREVLGLRKRGFEVFTYSVNKASANHDVDDEVISEKTNTKFILPTNIIALLLETMSLMFKSPRRFFSAVAVAFKTAKPGLKGALLQIAYFLEAVALIQMLKKDKVEHIHNHFGDNSGNVTLFASLLSNIPFSISIHGPHVFFDAKDWALAEKARRAAFFACIGHFCKSQLMLYTDIKSWDKFHIIRCGIDPQKFAYRRPSRKAKQLLYVGRLDAEKGVPILFSSLQLLNEQHYEVELVLLGDGADRAYLENLARELNIQNQVIFKGFVNQSTIAKCLYDCDIFVLPSFAEGIPVSFMEAMCVGVPVVATNVGGVSELVKNRETGLIVHASDKTGLANAIAEYIDNDDLCLRVSEAGHAFVIREFNIEDQVDKLADLFNTYRVNSNDN